MAIQISEDKLSEKARKALKNSKNKSQFLRDAIEFYVSSQMPEILTELKEIKQLIISNSQAFQAFSEQAAVNEAKAENEQKSLNFEKANETKQLQAVQNDVKNDSFSESEKAEINRMVDELLEKF